MNLKKFLFKFNPDEKGLKKILGELEATLMELVWANQLTTVRDIYEELLTRPLPGS